ncbi:jg3027 [Pararge aegeria aegeria]|uniref:Jg3027 protein n=1 Tax=Pararge aegeria aegeria TaxID=348720 RepID=A0A8S4QQF0_9NEOP|nr:jg3027 [Pararge aegeria aegeria]
MEAGRAFQILAVRIRNEDAKRFVKLMRSLQEMKRGKEGDQERGGEIFSIRGVDRTGCERLATENFGETWGRPTP